VTSTPQQAHFRGSVAVGIFFPVAYPCIACKFFSLFSSLSLLHAYYVWLTISFVLALLALLLVFDSLELSMPKKLLFFLAALAFTPLSIDCLAGGQTSCVGLLIYALVFILLRSGRDFRAGLVLGLGLYKPPLFLIFSLFTLLHRRWRVLQGAVLMGLILLLLSYLIVGTSGLMSFLHSASSYLYGKQLISGVELPPDQGVGFLAFLLLLFDGWSTGGWIAFVLLAGLLVSIVYRLGDYGSSCSRQSRNFDLLFALELSLSLFLSVQMIKYDVAIMLIPLSILASRLIGFRLDLAGVVGIVSILGFYAIFISPSFSFGLVDVKAVLLYYSLFMGAVLVMLYKLDQEKE